MRKSYNRIASAEHIDKDISVLREVLSSGNTQAATQLGKYNINIGEGQGIQIGDRIYNQLG
jgi:Effector-associated domain 10